MKHPDRAVEVQNQYFCLAFRKIILMTTKFISKVRLCHYEIVKGHGSPQHFCEFIFQSGTVFFK